MRMGLDAEAGNLCRPLAPESVATQLERFAVTNERSLFVLASQIASARPTPSWRSYTMQFAVVRIRDMLTGNGNAAHGPHLPDEVALIARLLAMAVGGQHRVVVQLARPKAPEWMPI
jgi:hypothetical protein